jgi:signal transduction histidine kinase
MSELSKLQSGTYVLRETNFDLSAVIREVVKLFTVMIEEGNLTVEIDCPDSLIVYGDETKLTEVIYNFLSNAVKHSPSGKTIVIRAFLKEDEETVRVEVKDEGEGIAPEDLPLIWERYQKSSKSFSRSMTSTGLGLSIVRAILESHNAKYGVISRPHEGSTFWFELENPKEVAEEEETPVYKRKL